MDIPDNDFSPQQSLHLISSMIEQTKNALIDRSHYFLVWGWAVKKEKVRTFTSETFSHLWTAIGLSFFALAFVFSKIGWGYCSVFYILLYAIGTYISGRRIKFVSLIAAGLTCFPLAILTAYHDFDRQIIMIALAILLSYMISGHLLRVKHRKLQAHV